MLAFLIWFDFTHKMYRRCILKHKSSLEDIPDEKFFVTLMGMKKGRKEVNLARVWRLHLLMRDILESAMLS